MEGGAAPVVPTAAEASAAAAIVAVVVAAAGILLCCWSGLSRAWDQLWAAPGPLPIAMWSDLIKGRLLGVVGRVERGRKGEDWEGARRTKS